MLVSISGPFVFVKNDTEYTKPAIIEAGSMGGAEQVTIAPQGE